MPAGMLSYLREQQSHHLLPGYMHMLVSGCAICVGLMSSTHHAAGRGSMVPPFQRQGNT